MGNIVSQNSWSEARVIQEEDLEIKGKKFTPEQLPNLQTGLEYVTLALTRLTSAQRYPCARMLIAACTDAV